MSASTPFLVKVTVFSCGVMVVVVVWLELSNLTSLLVPLTLAFLLTSALYLTTMCLPWYLVALFSAMVKDGLAAEVLKSPEAGSTVYSVLASGSVSP